MGELFATLSSQLTTLVHGEIELSKLKAKTFIRQVGAGGALLGAAVVFALYCLGWLFHSIELAITLALPAWAASLITVGIIGVIALVLALLGAALLRDSSASVPDPKAGITESIDALKKGLGK